MEGESWLANANKNRLWLPSVVPTPYDGRMMMDDQRPAGYDQTYGGSAPARRSGLRNRNAGRLDMDITPDETAAILLDQTRAFSRAVERFRADMEKLIGKPT